jgi:uncharacterized protein
MFTDGAEQVAGVAKAGDHVPPHWLSYWHTTNLDRSIAKAKERGATLMAGPMSMPGVGTFAVVTDPTGATFGLHQPSR